MESAQIDSKNFAFEQAFSFINQTHQSLFLTGKAGTGKTTFLKHVTKHSYKKMAITAPTGVAAMNAGGTTLHALFWLPFGTFIEDYPLQWNESDKSIYNKSRLFSTIKLTKQRRALIQELELLVIDEVSMVRADTLDAIDVILRSVRRDMRPFGGLQILFIGDLYQLPPVVRDHEWHVLRDHYASPFFFDSKVLRQNPPVMIELDTIYRQKDSRFISLLNNIRNNTSIAKDLEQLNALYNASFEAPKDDHYITLTSHNRIADQINQEQLQKLSGKLTNLNAVIKDDFNSSSAPAEQTLTLKRGAQVMFIKNDSGEDRRYYNGKIGVVQDILLDKNQVVVGFEDGTEDVVVKRETWENKKYTYDKNNDKIEEETLGTFSQYPLRLAWAITIHKSQGLTFDRAVIDAGTSFAAGQVYVALSRLRTLEGLVLRSKISPMAIRTDDQVVRFMRSKRSSEEIGQFLQYSQRQHLGHILMRTFRWHSLVDECGSQRDALEKRNVDQKQDAVIFIQDIYQTLVDQEKVANKFATFLQRMFAVGKEIDYDTITARTNAAVGWFLPQVKDMLIDPLTKHIDEWKIKKRTKKYCSDLNELLLEVKRKQEQLHQCVIIAEVLTKETADINELIAARPKVTNDNPSKPLDEEDTKTISLRMFEDGGSLEEIAKKRNMVVGTIYGHLIHFIGEEIEASDLMEQSKIDYLVDLIRKNPEMSSSELKLAAGQEYDYPDIRIAQKYLETDRK